jgi:hypothetical protein
MALVIKDRVKETTTTTGSSDAYVLAGAVSGFETFTANLSNSDTTYYVCTDNTDFEVGLGTFASSGTTLARTTILASSNSNNAVNWSSGTRTIFMTYPADKAVFKDASNNINGTFVGDITGNVTGNADTATTLETARTINGTSFNGGANITVTAAAGTLTGSTLNSGVTASSLTSLGTLASNLNLGGQDIVTTTSNQDIDLAAHGTGKVVIKGNDNQGAIKLNCEANSHGQTIIAAPHSESANNTLTLPSTGGDARLVTTSSTATLTNKTFDVEGTGNSISNIDVADFKSGVLDTDISSVSGSDDTLASAKAIKTYVDAQVTAQDLDIQGDSGGALSIDLDSETLTIAGGEGIDTSGSSNTITIAGEDATTSNKGIASFSDTFFSVSSGAVSLDAAQTGITSVLNASLVIGRDADNDIDFATDNNIIFRANGADQIKLTDGALVPVTDNDVDLGTSSLEFKDAFFDGTVTADAFAGPLTGDVTGNADTATTATNATHVTVTDNESTNEENLITFVENAQTGTGNHGLEMDGHLTYNPSTGIVTSNGFKPVFGGQANIIFTNVSGQLCFGMDGNSSNVVFRLDDEDGQPIFTFSEEGGTAILDGGDTDVTSHKPFIANSTITASGRIIVDDTTEATTTTDGSLQTDGGLSVAKDAVIGDDLKLLSDTSVLSFGADSDTTLTHVADTALLLNSSRQLQFGDSGTYIHQSADGVLDLVADTELELNGAIVDVNSTNGNVDISATNGNIQLTGDTGNAVKVTGVLETTGNIELGNSSDTTLSRASAGVMAVEGNEVLTSSTGASKGFATAMAIAL